MRRSHLLFSLLKIATEKYLEHLTCSDKELTELGEIFPRPDDSAESVRAFHAQLCETMKENGHDFVGIKVMPETHDAVKVFSGTRTVCVPLFTNMISKGPFSISQRRLQYIEMGLCLRMNDTVNSVNTSSDSLGRWCSSFSPVVEVAGSRFPFYPSSLNGLACDLGGCVSICVGTENLFSANDSNAVTSCSMVLLHGEEPVEVGSGKACMGGPLLALGMAASYAQSLGCPLERGHIVVCTGIGSRSPAQVGVYSSQWGLYGDATCTLL